SITNLAFDESRALIASADSSSRVLVNKIRLVSQRWEITETLIEHRTEEAVENLIFSPDSARLLIATTLLDVLYNLKGDIISTLCWSTRNAGLWTKHPQNPSLLFLIVGNCLRIYSWDDFR